MHYEFLNHIFDFIFECMLGKDDVDARIFFVKKKTVLDFKKNVDISKTCEI